MKLYTAEEMSHADARAQELGIPGTVLMERAGAQMARLALERFAPAHVVVVSGGGNNGGDGFVIARELYRSGVEVAVLATKSEYQGDPATNLEALRNLDVRLIAEEDLDAELGTADLLVDALLGTGFSGEVREREAGIIDQINAAGAPVLAVDVPSGVDGATGEVQGVAVSADLTVCAHAAKVGCVISPGREHSGEVVAVDIGIPPEATSVQMRDGATSASGGIPMSTATTSPECSRPGEITHPTFAACAQTASSAETATP